MTSSWTLPDPDEGYDQALAIAMDVFARVSLVAPGVEARVIDHGDLVELKAIRALAGTEGSGHVGRYLDTLPRDRLVVVPFVVSARLAGMLRRRGFHLDPLIPSGNHWTRRP